MNEKYLDRMSTGVNAETTIARCLCGLLHVAGEGVDVRLIRIRRVLSSECYDQLDFIWFEVGDG